MVFPSLSYWGIHVTFWVYRSLCVLGVLLLGKLTEVAGSVCKYVSEDSVHPFNVLIVAKSTG